MPDSSTTSSPPPGLSPECQIYSYVKQVALNKKAWTDTTLVVGGLPQFELHALFAARSPVLKTELQKLAKNGPPYKLELPCSDSALTSEAVEAALETLYGQTLDLAAFAGSLENARALLAAANLLGLKSISEKAYGAILGQISLESLPGLIELALEQKNSDGPLAGLLQTLESYLVNTLDLNQFSLRGPLADALAALPFEQLAGIVANPSLKAASNMQRHSFAREVVALRAKRNPNLPEESVVLAFGGGSNGVQIIQKAQRV